MPTPPEDGEKVKRSSSLKDVIPNLNESLYSLSTVSQLIYQPCDIVFIDLCNVQFQTKTLLFPPQKL